MAGVAQDSDTGGVELVASPIRMVVWTSLGLFMTGVAALLAFRLLPGYKPNGIYHDLISYGGLLFFGAGTTLYAWRALTLRGVVVAVDSNGILDKRISEALIPWSAVEDVSIRYVSFTTSVLVRLRPEFKVSFPVRAHALFVSVINRPFGWDGYAIFLAGLSGSKADFVTAMTKYWKHFKGGI